MGCQLAFFLLYTHGIFLGGVPTCFPFPIYARIYEKLGANGVPTCFLFPIYARMYEKLVANGAPTCFLSLIYARMYEKLGANGVPTCFLSLIYAHYYVRQYLDKSYVNHMRYYMCLYQVSKTSWHHCSLFLVLISTF